MEAEGFIIQECEIGKSDEVIARKYLNGIVMFQMWQKYKRTFTIVSWEVDVFSGSKNLFFFEWDILFWY